MQHDCSIGRMAVAVLAVLSLCCIVPMASDVDADIVYDREVTCYYYSVGMSWGGQDAETVTWDFGDGSEPETGFSVSHRYAEIGDYTVTLTGTNPMGSDVKYYLVHIMGYPVVSFESNGGSDVESIQMATGGNSAQAATQPADPVKDGYTFAGWYTDPELTQAYDWSKVVSVSITLYAKWVGSAEPMVTVSFDTDGGSPDVESMTVQSGSNVTLPYYYGEKEGYDFVGWNVDGQTIEPGTSLVVSVDTNFVAQWQIRTYTVSFSYGVESQTVNHGDKATMPEAPVRDGYDFIQWTLDGSAYDFDTPVTSDIALVAQWQVRTHTVSFDSGVASQTVNHGSKATVPTEPTKDGHDFVQWTLDGSAYDFDTPVTGDISLVAQWQIRTYTVSFDSGVASQTVQHGKAATEPQAPTREGYIFDGWYLGDDLYDFTTPVTSDISLTSHWTENGPGDEPGTDGPGEDEPEKKDDTARTFAIVAVTGVSIIGLLIFVVIRL